MELQRQRDQDNCLGEQRRRDEMERARIEQMYVCHHEGLNPLIICLGLCYGRQYQQMQQQDAIRVEERHIRHDERHHGHHGEIARDEL
jgi:hypothetical protein